MQAVPRLAALATAVPSYRLDQAAAAAAGGEIFAGVPAFERLRPVFDNTGIRCRYSAVPFAWFAAPHGWPERNRLYLDTAVSLLETAARKALDEAAIAPAEVGAVVVASTTGIATPSLDALLIDRLGLAPDVRRLPIFGLGCAGGAIGLGHAATLAAAMPDRAVLFLVVELCSITFRRDDGDSSNIVAAALFGDGAAALVLHRHGEGPRITASGTHTWPQTLDVMGWDVVEDGLKPVFSRDIPKLVGAELGRIARGFLDRHGLALRDIDRFVCHPGGPKVIAACEAAFGLSPETLQDARSVLRDYGNMSAASVLFVLRRALADPSPWEHGLVTALGPGFTAGFVLLERE